ncbi:PP2C family serine/threonine-protein phosphatase [Nocardia nepalensis]|uniref:PP2C family serine/threonine-protein phosphatase n=1 Tax=Nocardia nepalensis TaxID=3375448 RepID=UPI003B67DD94
MTISVSAGSGDTAKAESATPPVPGGLGRQWSVCGASVTGREHRKNGLGCDDAFAYGTMGDFVVAAVADGAGSVTQTSAWGSHTVCGGVVADVLTPWFAERFASIEGDGQAAEDLMESLFRHALGRLRHRAEYYGQPLGELATTLAVALARPGLAVFGQIGDGIIAVERTGCVETILVEKKAEYANLTWFVQSDNAFADSFRTHTATDVTAFALSTDGMSYKITDIPTGAAFVPFFQGAWSSLAAGLRDEDFAQWLDSIEEDQTEDDKTLVLARLQCSAESGSVFGASLTRRVSSRWPAITPLRPPVTESAAEG